jgi:hypothetical protein
MTKVLHLRSLPVPDPRVVVAERLAEIEALLAEG